MKKKNLKKYFRNSIPEKIRDTSNQFDLFSCMSDIRLQMTKCNTVTVRN